MSSQPKVSNQLSSRILLEAMLVSLGVFVGSLVGLAGIWLWFNYQSNPAGSILGIFSVHLTLSLPLWLQTYLGNQAQLMGLPLVKDSSAFWYMARAGGLISYLLIWLSTMWGLTLSSKITASFIPPALAYGLHQFLSILAIIFAALHPLSLLGDSYINFNLLHLLFPFVAPYKPLWTGLGTIGLYLSIALTLSFYVRKQIGQKMWRKLHYLTFLAYVLVLLHGLMAGTDTTLPIIKLMYLDTASSVLFLIYYRLFSLKVKDVSKK